MDYGGGVDLVDRGEGGASSTGVAGPEIEVVEFQIAGRVDEAGDVLPGCCLDAAGD